MKTKIQALINTIRPILRNDGGDVEFVDFKEGVVRVRLTGACAGCAMSQMTLKGGIERLLKKEIKGIKGVENVS
jgi:Fe-S cluster biogenesis protein NfuA